MNLNAKPVVQYVVSMPEPHTHYFEVELKVTNPSGKQTELIMPVWTPGSYLVREFSRNVEGVQAYIQTETGLQPVNCRKSAKNRWSVEHGKRNDFVVKYRVYAFEHSVRTSFLDADHGYINPASVFMVPEGTDEDSYEILIQPYAGWKKVVTALDQPQPFKLVTRNLDQFLDSPIEIGNPDMFEFTAAGITHTVAIHGGGNYNKSQMQVDMAKCVEVCTNVFGSNPNSKYVFILHNTESTSGGLEHAESTTLMMPRAAFDTKAGYQRFLSLVIHEYFHLWNVKRLRPEALGPFNYEAENYTDHLWLAEGFTAYYDEYLLRIAGFISDEEYIKRVEDNINSVETIWGNKVQPVAESSHDAWIKYYRRDENSNNSQVSYYSKGYNIALCLDAILRAESNNAHSLNTFMAEMYKDVYLKEEKGYTQEDIMKHLKALAPTYDFEAFMNQYVNNTVTLPYNDILSRIGLQYIQTQATKPFLGASVEEANNMFKVKSVKRASTAETIGLNVNDEILAINNQRIKKDWSTSLDGVFQTGQDLELLISRNGLIRTLKGKWQKDPLPRIELKKLEKPSPTQTALFNAWLNK